MREVLRKLEHVQELDTQIYILLGKKAEFPQRLVAHDQEIKTHQLKFDEKKKVLDELERNHRQQAGALELNEERIKRSQEKLEQIKTNQEYQALLKEIESLKKGSAVIQENAKKGQDEIDAIRKDFTAIETLLNTAQSAKASEQAKISEEQKTVETELARLNALRKDAIVGVDARYLTVYDRVRSNRGGQGIAAAAGGSCKGCNMRIPPQIYNELQRGDELHTCPSCRRILVYKEAVKAGTENSPTASR